MTYRDNIKAILETNFIGLSEEYLEGVCAKICEIQSDKTYEDGLNDAWECARKIVLSSTRGGMPLSVIDEIFDCCNNELNVLANYSASEAIAKIKEYEEQENEIHVGDEVRHFNSLGVVVKANNYSICVLTIDRNYITVDKMNLEKTGRYFPQIEEVLEQIRNEDRQSKD